MELRGTDLQSQINFIHTLQLTLNMEFILQLHHHSKYC